MSYCWGFPHAVPGGEKAEEPVLKEESQEQEKEEAMNKATEYYNSGNAKPGSMMAKANMVRQYNEKNNKK